MRALLVYYSRTGATKRVAEKISEVLGCDSEGIIDNKPRKGILGYLRSGKEASTKAMPEIRQLQNNPDDYELVVIGTPVWAWNMASPIRSFLTEHGKSMKQVAFFCTMGGSAGSTFDSMAKLSKKPVATLALKTADVKSADKAVSDFANKLKQRRR